MLALGIDVGGPAKGLDLVLLDEGRRVCRCLRRVAVAALPVLLDELKPDIVAIDSPAAFPSGGPRSAEREALRLGISLYLSPWQPDKQQSKFYDWMRAGHAVFAAAQARGYRHFAGGSFRNTCCEVFPYAAAVVLSGARRPAGLAKAPWRRDVAAGAGLDVAVLRGPDQVDAALAALTGLLALQGEACWLGDPVEGAIILPCRRDELSSRLGRNSSPTRKERSVMPHEHTNPDGVAKPNGYSHVVTARGSRMIFISGQTAVNAAGEVVGPGDLAAQAEQVYTNLEACLASQGATWDDVTRTTTYVVNYRPEMRPIITAARQKHLPAEPPASTLLGVQALARPEFLIEIEAIAVLP